MAISRASSILTPQNTSSQRERRDDLPPAIFVMGPTASGKTDLAMALSDRFPAEIISVDSALIYRGMDIGSAKPDAATLAAYPHRLVDILDPAQSYSVADFRADALAAMAEITAANKVPILVGGTMMYYKALLEGIAQLPERDLAVRAQIDEMAVKEGWEAVHQKLAEVDPESAARLHATDTQRLQRALEVYYISGESLTSLQAKQQPETPAYNYIQFAIAPENRAVLHQRIETRFHQMLEQGFVAEVERLYARHDLSLDLPSMRCVGYRQMWEYLDGQLSYEQMIDRGIIATRQLAKRQITWLRSWTDLNWLLTDAGEGDLMMSLDEITDLALKSLPFAPKS